MREGFGGPGEHFTADQTAAKVLIWTHIIVSEQFRYKNIRLFTFRTVSFSLCQIRSSLHLRPSIHAHSQCVCDFTTVWSCICAFATFWLHKECYCVRYLPVSVFSTRIVWVGALTATHV